MLLIALITRYTCLCYVSAIDAHRTTLVVVIMLVIRPQHPAQQAAVSLALALVAPHLANLSAWSACCPPNACYVMCHMYVMVIANPDYMSTGTPTPQQTFTDDAANGNSQYPLVRSSSSLVITTNRVTHCCYH